MFWALNMKTLDCDQIRLGVREASPSRHPSEMPTHLSWLGCNGAINRNMYASVNSAPVVDTTHTRWSKTESST